MVIKLSLAGIYLVASMSSFGQFKKIESNAQVYEMLGRQISDSNRQYLYNYLGRVYYIQSWNNKKDIDSAFYYLRKAVYLKDSVNYTNVEITNESLCLLAQTYICAGNIPVGKKICFQVIKNYQRYNQQSNEADTWRMMGKELWVRNTNDPNIQAYFDSAIHLYGHLHEAYNKTKLRIEKMNFLSSVDKQSESDAELQLILKEAKENDSANLSVIYKLLSGEERYKGNLNKGLEYSLEAVNYLDKAKDKNFAHDCYGELAQIYDELGEAEKSIYWYKKCIEERQTRNISQYVVFRTVSLMVVQMIKAKQEKEALALLQQLAKKNTPVGFVERGVLSQSFAYCYTALKRYKDAEVKFLEMIDDYKTGNVELEVLLIGYYDIGKFYIDLHQYTNAEPYLRQALDLGGSTTLRNKDLYLLLFKVDSAQGKFLSAINDFQNYKTLNDSIFNVAKSKQINQLMIQYETERKDQNIKLLEKENSLQQGKLTQANQTRNWIIGVALLFLLIIGLLINNSRLKQRTNKKLQAQQKEIENKNRSLQHLVQEKEWLVKEIHHRVKNNFHIVMGLLGTQSKYLKSEEAIQAITESQHRVHAMSLIHQKLYQSDNLSAINMVDYIHELVNYLRDSFNIARSMQFNLQIESIQLDLTHCVPLGLIMNEAITNAIKHAFPDQKEGIISVVFKHVTENHLLLTILDNGTGVPSNLNLEKPNTMGIKLMRGLIEDIEGTFSISNNNGTQITIDFIYDPDITNGITKLNPELSNSL